MRPASDITEQLSLDFSFKKQLFVANIMLGFAVLAYLLVNGPRLNSPVIQDSIDFGFQISKFDLWYSKFIFTVAVKSFYQMLVGVFGLLIAMHRHRQASFLIKSMLALLLIGIAHLYLIFWGDTLVLLAVLGISLLVFSKKSPKVLGWTLAFTMLIALILSVLFYHLHNFQPMMATTKSMIIYQGGNFFDVSIQRGKDFLGIYLPGIFYQLDAFQLVDFAVFYMQLYLCLLLGYWSYVSGVFRRLCMDYYFAQRMALISLSLSFMMGIIADSFVLLGQALMVFEVLARANFYACSIIFFTHQAWLRRFFIYFYAVGRMGLTNYIFHNLSLSLIFYGYGLGFYGQMGPFTQLPILLALMLTSLLLSFWWLRYFCHGPLECLLDAFIQGNLVVFKKRSVESAGLCVD